MFAVAALRQELTVEGIERAIDDGLRTWWTAFGHGYTGTLWARPWDVAAGLKELAAREAS